MYLSYRYKLERYITCIKLWKKNYYCCKFESRKNKLHILQKLIKKRIISIEFIFILFQNSNTHNFIWKLLLLKVTFLRIILYRMFIQIETRIRRRWKEKLNRRIVFFLPCNETMHSHRTTRCSNVSYALHFSRLGFFRRHSVKLVASEQVDHQNNRILCWTNFDELFYHLSKNNRFLTYRYSPNVLYIYDCCKYLYYI